MKRPVKLHRIARRTELPPTTRKLEAHCIRPRASVYWDSPSAILYEHTLKKDLGQLAQNGAIVVGTTPYTGRSPKDKFIVREPATREEIWWGEINQPVNPNIYSALYHRVTEYLEQRDFYVQDVYAGIDPDHRIAVRIITESPWHALFARNMFILPEHCDLGENLTFFMPGK